MSLETSLPQLRVVIRCHVDIASKHPCTRRKCICCHEQSIADFDFFRSDQGKNAWQLDWSKTGGYNNTSVWYLPLPCCCGYQCSGTAAFFEANNATDAFLLWVAKQCQYNLMSVDPVWELETANIGWNLISGGPPPSKSIDYGQGNTATMPNPLPTPCYMGVRGCNGVGKIT